MPETDETIRPIEAPTADAPRPGHAELAAAVDRLVDEERIACLWFMRPDYYPRTDEERLRVLGSIERRGGLQAFRRAATLRRWLSPTSSDASAGS
jgi:hypothetical protein